jgi:TRAP-type C4-dicarboxylate transport system permease small subunit
MSERTERSDSDERTPDSPGVRAGHEGAPGQAGLPVRNPVLRAVAFFENVLIGLLLTAIVVVMLAQVTFRYILSQPLSWSTEVATGLMLYVAFVGFAIGVRDNAHVALNLFERRLNDRGRRVVRTVELVFLGWVLLALGIGTVQYISQQSDVTTPVGLPLWSILLAIPLGSALGILHVIVEIIHPTPPAILEQERELVGGGV